jgi:hypothetical protein
MVECRWLSGDEIESAVNPALKGHGQPQLNINPEQPTCRVAGAFVDGVLVRAFVLQMFPILGPMIETDSTHRDNGELSHGLADFMDRYLKELPARGALTICERPMSERLAKAHGMTKVEDPVYMWNGTEG